MPTCKCLGRSRLRYRYSYSYACAYVVVKATHDMEMSFICTINFHANETTKSFARGFDLKQRQKATRK